MKHIILMRHAKSDWSNGELTDHQRTLNTRGNLDAPLMATRIKGYGKLPELMLVSDATRTRETWQHITKPLGNVQTKFDRALYMASPYTIIEKLKEVDNLIDTVLLIAHNPGITEVFHILANIDIDNVPTAGVGCIQLHTDKFSEIENCKKNLVYFTYPKG
jgi:phosphohistidine phosphatase